MPDNVPPNAPPNFPDVLGAITDDARHVVGIVQCAFAIYPRAIAVGQLFEALVMLQNACDQPVQVTITIQLPRKDTQGKRLTLVTLRDVIPFSLPPAEMGLLHVPMMPHLPTQSSQGNTLSVRIEAKPPKAYNLVRLLQGGRPPAMLKLSPTRLNILRELGFSAASPEAGVLAGIFDVTAGHVDGPAPEIKAPWYETLWGPTELGPEQAKYAALEDKAKRFARIFSPLNIIDSMVAITTQRFSQIGLPLQPGEALAISKALIYVMLDNVEKNFPLTERRWFQKLVVNVEDDALMGDLRQLIATLYTAIVHDAVRIGLSVVERASGEHLGSSREHLAFADEVVAVLDRQSQAGLVHAYLPLALVGVLFNGQIRGARENPWTSLLQMDQARTLRLQASETPDDLIFGFLDKFMETAEQYLNKNQIPRP